MVPDAGDRAAAVAARLQLLMQALQSRISDHQRLHGDNRLSLGVDFCPQDTLQVILKDIQIRDGDNNCMYNSDWMLTRIYRWIDD